MTYPDIIVEYIKIPESCDEVCDIQLLCDKKRYHFEYTLDVEVYFQYCETRIIERFLHIGEIKIDPSLYPWCSDHRPYNDGPENPGLMILLQITHIEEILNSSQLNRKVAMFSDDPCEYQVLQGYGYQMHIIPTCNSRFLYQ